MRECACPIHAIPLVNGGFRGINWESASGRTATLSYVPLSGGLQSDLSLLSNLKSIIDLESG